MLLGLPWFSLTTAVSMLRGASGVRDTKDFSERSGLCANGGGGVSFLQDPRQQPPGKPGKALPPDSPQRRTGLASKALGPQVVLCHDDQGQVAGGQGA